MFLVATACILISGRGLLRKFQEIAWDHDISVTVSRIELIFVEQLLHGSVIRKLIDFNEYTLNINVWAGFYS